MNRPMSGSRLRRDDQFVNDAPRACERPDCRPPVTRISLAEMPTFLAAGNGGAPDGKTIIVPGEGETE
jgi:hypothetical protein